MADLDALGQSTGSVGERARSAVEVFKDAHRSREPSRLASAVDVYQKVEGEIRSARQAWEKVLAHVGPDVQAIIGVTSLATLPEWDPIRDSLIDDADALRATGLEALPHLPVRIGAGLDRIVGDNGRIDRLVDRANVGGSHEQCAAIVMEHDRLRKDVVDLLGGKDPHDAILAAHRLAVIDSAEGALQRVVPADDAFHKAVMDFVDPPGWAQIQALQGALAAEADDLDAIVDMTQDVQAIDDDPWITAAGTVLARLQAASPELVRYLGGKPAGWDDMLRHADGVRWVYDVVRGLEKPGSNQFVENLREGTKRLLAHTLKEARLWIS